MISSSNKPKASFEWVRKKSNIGSEPGAQLRNESPRLYPPSDALRGGVDGVVGADGFEPPTYAL
jgi:hypothetical protein